ncbi:MAG: DUF1801 domain-containing protein [Thermoanaerobaculia bacterium]
MRSGLIPEDIDAYIAAAAPEAQAVLRKLRATLRKALPKAEERISYRMPALFLDGAVIYFAAFKKHIGIFPPLKGDAALQKAIAPYRGPKGNLQFPLSEPMPYALIARFAKARAAEQKTLAAKRTSGRKSAKKSAKRVVKKTFP